MTTTQRLALIAYFQAKFDANPSIMNKHALARAIKDLA